MDNRIRWSWKDSMTVGTHEVAESLDIGGKARYTIRPPKVKRYKTQLDSTYRRKCNEQWERLPQLRDRSKVWKAIADGFVWDRECETFVMLDRPYEIKDEYGNIELLDIETGKRIDIYDTVDV